MNRLSSPVSSGSVRPSRGSGYDRIPASTGGGPAAASSAPTLGAVGTFGHPGPVHSRARTGSGWTTGSSEKVTRPRATISIWMANGSTTVPGTVKKAVPSATTPSSIATECQIPAGSTTVTGASNREAAISPGSVPW